MTISVAIVSGKGGSGKTMFSASLMRSLDEAGLRVILVDGDIGTGGSSYFLGMEHVRSIQTGLSDALLEFENKFDYDESNDDRFSSVTLNKDHSRGTSAGLRRMQDVIQRSLQDVRSFNFAKFLPIGGAVDVFDDLPEIYERSIKHVIDYFDSPNVDVVLIDCRGGIDRDSIAVCNAVNHVLLLSETDAASIQAGQRISRLLLEQRPEKRAQLATKRRRNVKVSNRQGRLIGFVINKAFSDPTSLAQTGSSFFRAPYLGAIPFDYGATRSFIFGRLPDRTSYFHSHVCFVARRLFPDHPGIEFPLNMVSGANYELAGTRDTNSVAGGKLFALLALLSLLFGIYSEIFLPRLTSPGDLLFNLDPLFAFAISGVFGFLGCFERTRKLFGKLFYKYTVYIIGLASRIEDSKSYERKKNSTK